MKTRQIHVIDSHTGGEPTRVVLDGGPELGAATLVDRMEQLRDQFDWLRTALVNEPRGSEVMVGALVCPPHTPDCATGVIFFNNVGYLGMCGHGTIGLMVSLAHAGRLGPGEHFVDTVTGPVRATLHDAHRVSVANVPSYRHRKDVSIDVPDVGQVVGDIAWGGNWFFLVADHGQTLSADNTDGLTEYAWRIRLALEQQNITGASGGHIDHIELFAPPSDPDKADSRSFVLCPGKAFDRSPCGTGTSAKLACLADDQRLAPGQTWRQESIIGSVFEASYELLGDRIIPTICGTAYVNGETKVILDDEDPFRNGIGR